MSSQADPVGYTTSGSPAVFTVNAVPEPASLPLLAASLLGLAVLARRSERA